MRLEVSQLSLSQASAALGFVIAASLARSACLKTAKLRRLRPQGLLLDDFQNGGLNIVGEKALGTRLGFTLRDLSRKISDLDSSSTASCYSLNCILHIS